MKKNFIAKLQGGDQIAASQEDKHAAVWDFYENQIGTAEERNYTIELAEIGLQQRDLSSLDAPFLEDEVWATIKDMPLDKAPGPDSRVVSTNLVGASSKGIYSQFLGLSIVVMCSNSGSLIRLSFLFCPKDWMPFMLKITGPLA